MDGHLQRPDGRDRRSVRPHRATSRRRRLRARAAGRHRPQELLEPGRTRRPDRAADAAAAAAHRPPGRRRRPHAVREDSQIGVFLRYATTRGRALLDRRLYLPEHTWLADLGRCHGAGVPDETGFATTPALAIQMLLAAIEAGCR
ncbi:transposase [Nonomuraea sp. NPDC050451]|uniref:transposase n=1 Tax=Nonomuraea sp. NPDC050451 TaxID=3364364 RepID=UPI0037AFAF06